MSLTWGTSVSFLVAACLLAEAAGGDFVLPQASLTPSALVTYRVSPKAQASWSYEVSVNGQPVFVERWQDISYVHFAFAGKADVVVHVRHSLHATQPVKTYRLSPVSYGIASDVADRDIRFTLDRPRKLVLWQVDGVPEKLLIFADPLEDNAPRLGDAGVANVLDYGVDGAGKTDSTAQIQRAMDETAARKGMLYFPPGEYLAGDLLMNSHLTCYLAGGATIEAAGLTRDATWKTLAFESGADDARLIGRGTLSKYHLRGYANKRIRIEGVILRSGPLWSVTLKAADHVTIDNFKLIGCYEVGGSDGIDPDLARHWVIEDTFILAGDDAIAIKALDETTAEDIARSSEDVRVSNCVLMATSAGFAVGTETENAAVKNMTFENTDCVSTASPIAQCPAHPCVVENIWYRNIRVEEVPRGHRPYLVYLVVGSPEKRSGGAVNPFGPGKIKHVVIENLSAEQVGPKGSCILGFDQGHSAEDIALKNLHIAGKLVTDAATGKFATNAFARDIRFIRGQSTIVSVSAAEPYATRGHPGVFTIHRTGDLTRSMTVSCRVRGTAKSGADYAALAGSATIPAGKSAVSIVVEPTTAGFQGRLKTVLLQLTNKHGWESEYMLGPDFQAVISMGSDRQ
jgi:hypothetical protein